MAQLSTKFASARQEWETPPEFFAVLDREFHFTIDLAADSSNHKCTVWYDASQDALRQDWEGVGWLNPPYGSESSNRLSVWVEKAYKETEKHEKTVIVCLIPARTNTNWFHEYCMKAKEIRFVKGRPKFVGATHGLPQPLLIVVFQKNSQKHPLVTTQDFYPK